MRLIAPVIFLVVLLAPLKVLADSYFEFLPDFAQQLPVQPGQVVEQVFLPLNDHVSSVQFWISDSSQPTSVKFTLFSPAGSVLNQQTISLPAIADVGNGSPVSVSLSPQIGVTADAPYRLRIEPVSGPVRLAYGETGGLLPVGGVGTAYRYGAAVVNGEEQGFSLLFALFENAETGKPIIGNRVIEQTAIGRASVTFTANEPVDYRLSYGSQRTAWLGNEQPCVSASIPCIAVIGVSPGTRYPYTLTVRDAWGNESSVNGEFTAVGTGPGASPTPETTPSGIVSAAPSATPGNDGKGPVILNPRLVGLSPTTATFAWSTSKAATSWVVILVRPELVAHSGHLDSTLELEHYVTMTGLPPDQYLRARITSVDVFGNTSVAAIDFQTPNALQPPSGTQTPAASPGSSPPAGSMNPSSSPAPTPTPRPSPSYSVVSSPGPSPSGLLSPSPQVSTTALPPPVTASVDSSGNGTVAWTPSPSCDDAYGYRIDVFGTENTLIASLHAGCAESSVTLPAGTPVGARVIVYADHGGAFEKIAPDTVVVSPPPTPLLKYPLLTVGAVVVLLAMVVSYLRLRRRDRTVAPPPMSPDAPFMGVAARR